MPLYICKNINAQMKPYDIIFLQLDIMFVKVVGELNDVLIGFSEDQRV